MAHVRLACILGIPLTLAATASRPDSAPPQAAVRFISDEADAVLAILRARAGGRTAGQDEWHQLFTSEGYRALARREAAMGRAFTDDEFHGFVLSDTLAARTSELERTLEAWKRLDVAAAAARASAYLPPGTPQRARVFLEIKPRTNSFVFDLDGARAIFLYVDPAVSPARLDNTLAHELHHVGQAAACDQPADTTRPASVRSATEWMTAFGEGLAMLAAAGGPDVHPHAVSAAPDRARWDRDLSRFDDDLAALQRFFFDVLDARADRDSLQRAGMSFFGTQGPWYTVGWRMWATVERTFGRARLLAIVCDPARLLTTYNAAAAEWNRTHQDRLALWSDSLLARVEP
jgi:hypothetical protein